MHVRRQAIQANAGKILVTDPKSDAGRRKVMLPSFTVAEVRDHLDRWEGRRSRRGCSRGQPGARPTRNNFHTIWSKARTKAGIPELHLHDLRHTGNTLAAETGAMLREPTDRMGHASTRAALIYLRAREERNREIAQWHRGHGQEGTRE